MKSSEVVDDLPQDKWAEWTEKQSRLVPSDIKEGSIVIHVVDNIDWKNRNIKTHNTNGILIQQSKGQSK
jgi:hypothetical protein